MNFKSVALTLLASLSLACPGISNAGVLHYTFHGVVNEYSSPAMTSFFADGAPISGRIALDDSLPDSSPFPEAAWYYGSVNANFNVGGINFAVVNGYTGVHNASGVISLAGGPTFGVGGELSASGNIDGWSLVGWNLMSIDTAAMPFDSSNAFPSSAQFASDTLWRSMYLTYANGSGEYEHVVMNISAVAAIPEPGSLVLLGLGAFALTAGRRTGRARKADGA